MSQLENINEQFKNLGAKLGQQIQESPSYAQAQDKYENLSPVGQKMVMVGGVLLILFLLLFIPLSNLSDSQTTLGAFEEKRSLIRDLFKTYRESSATPSVVRPPDYESLRSNVESIIARAELLPEQNLGTIEITAEGKLIPQNLITHALQVKLAKLNLKQIVDIGSSLVGISESVKMKDMQITANSQDTRYFDVSYKLYSLKVPEPQAEAPVEEPKKGNRGSDK
ncbi:hypothetical protein K2P97_11865 [bacterium]|nr:hypothetical protein [bacterium]